MCDKKLKVVSTPSVVVFLESHIGWAISRAAILHCDRAAAGVELEHIPSPRETRLASPIHVALTFVHVALRADVVSRVESLSVVQADDSLTFVNHSTWQ
jgi:hypothetical protein